MAAPFMPFASRPRISRSRRERTRLDFAWPGTTWSLTSTTVTAWAAGAWGEGLSSRRAVMDGGRKEAPDRGGFPSDPVASKPRRLNDPHRGSSGDSVQDVSRRTLICYDGTDSARAAVATAADVLQGSAVVLTVWEPVPPLDHARPLHAYLSVL